MKMFKAAAAYYLACAENRRPLQLHDRDVGQGLAPTARATRRCPHGGHNVFFATARGSGVHLLGSGPGGPVQEERPGILSSSSAATEVGGKEP